MPEPVLHGLPTTRDEVEIVMLDCDDLPYTEGAWRAMVAEFGFETIAKAAALARAKTARGERPDNPAGWIRGACKFGPRFSTADAATWNALVASQQPPTAEDDTETSVEPTPGQRAARVAQAVTLYDLIGDLSFVDDDLRDDVIEALALPQVAA